MKLPTGAARTAALLLIVGALFIASQRVGKQAGDLADKAWRSIK